MSEIIRETDQVVIKPAGDVTASEVDAFRTELQSLIRESPGRMVIDLGSVRKVDLAATAVMIAAYNSLRDNGGELNIINVNTDTYNLFNAIRLDRHFTIIRSDNPDA